jgi:hypothetical protein
VNISSILVENFFTLQKKIHADEMSQCGQDSACDAID